VKLLPMERLGAHETGGGFDFGLLLPWVSAGDGNRVSVKIIHEHDQFLQAIQPLEIPLSHTDDPENGDYWSGRVELDPALDVQPGSAWGDPGRYVYRYVVHPPHGAAPIDWVIDPFAREFGVGKLSAITCGYEDHAWSEHEAAWRTPALADLVIYELMVSEFGGDINGAIAHLDYLADLGVNCLELMPVANVGLTVDWGYLPIGYFGVDERFGKRCDLQRLVDAAHARGLAVIVDAVYAHASTDFPYADVYRRLNYHENPVMGPFAGDAFGVSSDFGRAFTRDFFYTANVYWLDRYHVDGFRYDYVPGYWDGPVGVGYANLVYETYRAVEAQRDAGGHWRRFFPEGEEGASRLIQCAEQLEAPEDVLRTTYSTCTWQNQTLGAAQKVAAGQEGAVTDLGFRLGLAGYPTEVTHNDDRLPKSSLQYVENHDHERFVCNFGVLNRGEVLLQDGDRDRWFKVQPYLIGLLTAKGIPLLWQGQEFGENYWIPEGGIGRVMLLRPVRWDYFYDPIGRAVVTLVRKLLRLRRAEAHLRSGEHFFYNDPDRYQDKGLLLFSRQDEQAFTLIALNFGDADQTAPFWFPRGGKYQEGLHGEDDLLGVVAGEERRVSVPSNYGRIWTSHDGP
jgi:maltooligosyltrehalose trehalohydrolase